MKLYLKYDHAKTYKALLTEQFEALALGFTLHGLGEVELSKPLSSVERESLTKALQRYGIEIIADQKTALVQRIKEAIHEMLHDEQANLLKVSAYLADKLAYSYAYLSTIFSEATYMSIENFVILKKVDRVKSLMANTDLTLTEIAFKLNYSSVAHLSGQFKKTTGLTPSAFQKIIARRKSLNLNTL